MTVWVFKGPTNDEKATDFVYASLKKGISRFGWSYINDGDLFKLREKGWDKLEIDEKECYNPRLMEIEKGDWIVHVNVPKYGQCTAGKVKETYKWDEKPTEIGVGDYSINGDFRHTFELDSIIEFDRNDPNITPDISRRLKLQGRIWRIYETERFLLSLDNFKNKVVNTKSNVEHGLYYLKEDIKPLWGRIAESIHKNHPGKRLEELIGSIFKNVPNVKNVKINGSGYGTDYGADLIVTYSTGLPINGLQKEESLVIQVKSFSGLHNDLNAIDQIKTAIKKYDANYGLIISTANASEELIKKIDEAAEKINVPIALMCYEDVATFVLKYGSEHLL